MNFMGGPDLTGHHPDRRMRQAELVRHDADKRRIMRTIRDTSLISVATAAVLTLVMAMPSASAQEFPGGEQDIFGMSIPEAMPVAPPPMDVPDMGDGTTAADAALGMANLLDGAGGGVSSGDLMAALENASDAGQPMAMWQLGTMYENGEGVTKDPVKAFGYFAQIANQHADAAPKGVEADIVARSFVKVGDYYKQGLPGAGIPADAQRSHALLLHAATYFGDADAQYRVGLLYTQEGELGVNPLQSARWFSLAARKGYCPAQAQLGHLLFNGIAGIEAQPTEGLMWLTIAHERCAGTADAAWVDDMLLNATSLATPDEQAEASNLAANIAPQFAGF